jgi:hypothetical protein
MGDVRSPSTVFPDLELAITLVTSIACFDARIDIESANCT